MVQRYRNNTNHKKKEGMNMKNENGNDIERKEQKKNKKWDNFYHS